MLLAKHLLTACLLVMAPLAIFAQFEKGTNSLGGNGRLNLSYQPAMTQVNQNGDSVLTRRKNRVVSLSVSYFRFVSDKVSVGMGVNWAYQLSSSPYFNQGEWGERRSMTNSYSIQPQLRYHFPITERWYFFLENYLEATASIQTQTRPDGPDINEDKTSRYEFGAGIRPGIILSLTKKWSLEGIVDGIQLFGRVTPDSNGGNNFQINANLLENFSLGSIKLGVRRYF